MRVFSYLILLALTGLIRQPNNYIVLNSKRFTVEGSTSIGNFTCNYDLSVRDTLFLNQKSGFLYQVPVKEFGCGNFLLNRDFRKTLKENQYPEVDISLSDVRRKDNHYIYNLHLNLAGKKKVFQDLVLAKEGNILKGTIELKFGDFDLEPPKKLGGAIKINEEIKLSVLLRTQ